jgi:glucosamine 6-phosphate synthetase-like amidotransferase/phosphosugar isomerase protein
MCGIAGYSLSPKSSVDRTLAAQALLAAIAERGADAVGYAHRTEGGAISVHKQRTGASALLDRIEIPDGATEVLIHVRDYTKGHPRIEANNHPVCHGSIVGIHNGTIANDDEIFEERGFERAAPEMTVDSEVIFAVAQASQDVTRALEDLRGSMATAWLDERRRNTVFLARGVGRPLWLGTTRHEAFFASTEHALEVLERYTGLKLRKRELPEGIVKVLEQGRIARADRFRPDREYDEKPLPAVRAPSEGALCLSRLAAIATSPS